jgi:polyisoprenoid-binding protein YceI
MNNLNLKKMKKSIFSIALIAFTVLATSLAWMPTGHYEVSEGYDIDFKSKDPSGSFKKMDGSVEFDESNIESTQFNLKIEVKSISTGNGMMNKKSQTAEWFDGAKYPYAKFKSTKVTKKGTELTIVGDLTIKGTTKQYTIPATYSKSGDKVTFKGTFNVNRMDFKVGKKSGTVPDLMKVSFQVPTTKK